METAIFPENSSRWPKGSNARGIANTIAARTARTWSFKQGRGVPVAPNKLFGLKKHTGWDPSKSKLETPWHANRNLLKQSHIKWSLELSTPNELQIRNYSSDLKRFKISSNHRIDPWLFCENSSLSWVVEVPWLKGLQRQVYPIVTWC